MNGVTFEKAENGRSRCRCCGFSIPKHLQRIKIPYLGSYNKISYTNICGSCLKKMYKLLNKKEVVEWEKKKVAENL